MQRARRQPASLATAEAIKGYIAERGLKPGDVMPTESELCEALGVSRSSVREAIRDLVTLDIVEVRHGHGTYVGAMSLAPLVNGMMFRFTLEPTRALRALRDVVETRLAIELSLSADLLRARGGTADPELHELVDDMHERQIRGEAFVDADRTYHARLMGGVENAMLAELADAFWEIHTKALPLLGIAPPEDISQTVAAHRAMLEAIEKNDLEAYRAAVQAHYAPLRRALQRAMTEAGIPV